MTNRKSSKRNILNLIIGIAFLSYGSYRLYSYYSGEELSDFRLIIAIGFVLLGAFDLYKYFRPPSPE